jgi:hypothetical protein
VDPKVQGMVREFLMKREHDLEEFGAKKLTDEQQGKINEIISYLTGKASSSFSSAKESKPSSEDFAFEEVVSGSKSTSDFDNEEDFFKDF